MNNTDNLRQKNILSDLARQYSEKFVTPIVKKLAVMGITPNMLTIAGVCLHLPVAWLLANGRWQAGALLGLLSLLDAFDGALARQLPASQHNSRFGAFLDSVSDRIAEIILFAGLLYYFTLEANQLGIAMTYFALAGSLMVSYLRARAEGVGFNCRIGYFGRFERYITLFIFGMLRQPLFCMVVLTVGTWLTVMQRLLHVYRQANQSDAN